MTKSYNVKLSTFVDGVSTIVSVNVQAKTKAQAGFGARDRIYGANELTHKIIDIQEVK